MKIQKVIDEPLMKGCHNHLFSYLSPMIMINNVIVESDVYESLFVCNIDKCKGICCIEGDFGAPLEENEIIILEQIQEIVAPYLEKESIAYLKENGPTTYYAENKTIGTPVHEDGRCAYAVFNKDGSIGCGIEHAWRDKKIDFQKPLSCHLYPIRIKSNATNGMEMMTYERWDICSDACSYGKELDAPLYKFCKDSVVRKYGEEFFVQLEAAVEEITSRRI